MYNTMMITLLLSLLSPILVQPALAYETPEDVLLRQLQYYGTTNYPPPTKRQVNQMRSDLEQQREAQHPSTVIDLNLESDTGRISSSSSSDTSAPADDPSLQGAAGDASSAPDDPALVRLLERLKQATHNAEATGEHPSGGKPLAPTGMASVAAVAVLGIAAVMTLLRARRMHKRR